MTNRDVLFSVVAAAAAIVLPSGAALGGTFSISPLRIELSDSAPTGALTVRNEENVAAVVQVDGKLWEQAGGEDKLTASRDLLVSPVVFTLPPKGSQLVRIALRRSADATRELGYRITLQEVPQPASPDFNGLKVALRLSLPVFVASQVHTEPKLDWSARSDGNGGYIVTAGNSGTAHARILNFSVAPVGGAARVFDQPVAAYVLPGQSRNWTFGGSGMGKADVAATPAAAVLHLKGRTDTGEFATELAVQR